MACTPRTPHAPRHTSSHHTPHPHLYIPHTAGGSPLCTAIITELCDCGSLNDVLAARTFPQLLQLPATAAAAGAGSGQQAWTHSHHTMDMQVCADMAFTDLQNG